MWSRMIISSSTRSGWLTGSRITIGPKRIRSEFWATTVSDTGCDGAIEKRPVKWCSVVKK